MIALAFYNTDLYLTPKNGDKQVINDGHRLVADLPIQMERQAAEVQKQAS